MAPIVCSVIMSEKSTTGGFQPHDLDRLFFILDTFRNQTGQHFADYVCKQVAGRKLSDVNLPPGWDFSVISGRNAALVLEVFPNKAINFCYPIFDP